MTLRDYVQKRNFNQTPEPRGEAGARGSKRPIFVVQLHQARTRHYDFRLEADGVLKSWAVPKGPSLRPGEKRLAVQVEDHPLEYAGFEGDIPPGQYGAGHVDCFDRGVWACDGDPLSALANGKLEFILHGKKLRGAWTLVRTQRPAPQPQWLLIKRDDGYARAAEADDLLDDSAATDTQSARQKPKSRGKTAAASVRQRSKSKSAINWRRTAAQLPGARPQTSPLSLNPQLATLHATAPRGKEWLHEVKWDGYRFLAEVNQGKATLYSRGGLDWTADVPEIAAALAALPVKNARFDGEIVALNADGYSDFALLQKALEGSATVPLRYILFDLPALEGLDLTDTPLIDRKRLLEQLLAFSDNHTLAFSSHIVGHGPEVFAASIQQGLEGIISKRVDAPYSPWRSPDWVKVKHEQTDEFVIVGYTAPKGTRTGFGSLLLARPESNGLQYVGRVGTGFDDATLKALTGKLAARRQTSPTVDLPAHVPFSVPSVRWVKPDFIAEVAFRGWAKEGLLRQAAFKRLRADKSLKDLAMANSNPIQSNHAQNGNDVPLTHPGRQVYVSPPWTKQDVAEYYRAVADWMLPELINRPLSLLRCSDGAENPCFFQKHYAESLGNRVQSIALQEKEGGREDYLYISDLPGLLELVQMNVLEFHPWGARIETPEQPDRLVFDLDPGNEVAWDRVIHAAYEVRARLIEVGLTSFVRLSGGKGLHVVVPVSNRPSWDEARQFCEAFANAMSQQQPRAYLASMSKAKRHGRIFIDWLRNTRGATSVASWSLRARVGAPVAMPLRWEELPRIEAADAYDLAKAKRRAAALKSDPWQEVIDRHLKQNLPALK